MNRRLLAAAALVAAATLGACTPAQIAAFKAASPADQARIIAALNAPSRDCAQAIDRHWPAGARSTAHRVMQRESGNVAHIKNRSSSATGCFQLLSLHDHRYPKVGCRVAQKVEPDCGVRAAAHLFNEQGWRPWSLTV